MQSLAVFRDFYERKWCSFEYDGTSIEDEYYDPVLEEKSEIVSMLEVIMSPNKRSRSEESGRKVFTTNLIATMEQEIWKELPEDLYEAVIARLPIATLFRLRLVCRKWNSLPTSSSFAHHFTQVKRTNPWFYTIVHHGNSFDNVNGGTMYDPSLKKWHHLSIPVLRSKIFLKVASVGGLVCFFDYLNGRFYICNPLIKTVKELPPSSARQHSRLAVGMVLTNNTSNISYKVVWLGYDGDHEIYDSLQNSWSHQGSLPQSIKLPLSLNVRSQTVCIGSTLYFIRADPDGILTFDVAAGVWKQFIIPLPLHIAYHTIAECGGKVMLVGLLSKNAATCVCIWELQKMTLLWKEVDRMPNVSCLQYYGKHVTMTCMGNQGMIMLSLRSISSTRSNDFITYDLREKKWGKVPDCTLPFDGRKGMITCGTTFYPCPTALP